MERGHPFRVFGSQSAMEHIFNETAMQARTSASNCQEKAIKASHGPRVSPQSQADEMFKRTKENPKESRSKGSGNCKTSKTGFSGLENLNQKQVRKSGPQKRRRFTRNGVCSNGMMIGVVLDGMKIANTYSTFVSAFSLESSELVNTNQDTGATVNTFLMNFDGEGVGDGSFCGTGSPMAKFGNKDAIKGQTLIFD